MRRFTRLTNAFSKKVENHAYAVALHMMNYNLVPGGMDELRRVRKLDCAIIKYLHQIADDPNDSTLSPFDTVV